ncbi:MAG: isoprenyl transferase [Rickettsiales bacterium]|nr:isoprenyl transferase [Pseudomonadota bacterium]MDA0967104.1 isoprenyl transferase [Pseudomonadota bacterium]MDG4542410.1 isoprenyl transferase [Rickettsiales bacterium]MDG4544914.1 isoprenyl transferase [Rickettsiales bacterium]MDG4547037.1 isoprenyl transferase [Rickettsiales bacterium]
MENEFPPVHIAIIMDGNGRWAKQRNMPRISGHKKGAESVREAIEACIEKSVSHLTLYAFSSENWSRPVDEVEGLMELLNYYLGKELKQLNEKNIKLNIIGDRTLLSDKINAKIQQAEELTKDNKSLCLTIALSYGGRQEIVSAAKKIVSNVIEGGLDKDKVDEKVFESFLYTSGIPDPDLLIRTSGEKRLSNFLLWQLAYTELFFIDVLWPDLKKQHILDVINDFTKRERRYGNS